MLIGIMPQAIGSHLPIFIGALSGPIGMMLGTDSFFFGFMPLVLGVGEKFAASAHDIAMAMLIGKDFTILVTPHNATTFLLCGLAGVSIKEHLKFCTPYLWILSWITLQSRPLSESLASDRESVKCETGSVIVRQS